MLHNLSRREVILGLASSYVLYPKETQPKTKARATTEYIAVHGAFTYPDMDIGAKEIDRWHRQRGFFQIGYHCIIRRDGTIEQGRPDHLIGAAVYGYNDVSWHVCLVGGKSRKTEDWENNYTNAQFRALGSVLKKSGRAYPDAMVLGHRDFPRVSKGCPGFDIMNWFG